MNTDILKDLALDYLENKYGEKFELISVITGGLDKNEKRIGAKPKGAPFSKSFTVYADGERLNDNFFKQKAKENLQDTAAYTAEKFLFSCDYTLNHSASSSTTDGKPEYYGIMNVTVTQGVSSEAIIQRGFECAAEEFAKRKIPVFLNRAGNPHAYEARYENGEYRTRSILKESAAMDFYPVPLSAWQLERLCNVVYLEQLPQFLPLGRLGTIMRCMLDMGFLEEKNRAETIGLSREEWRDVMTSIVASPSLYSLRIADYVDISERSAPRDYVKPGHRAVCFADSAGNAAAVFRGTGSDYEWLDNGEGMLDSDTVQQQAAAEFVRRVRQNTSLGIKHLTVAGHSKGGNKAQYTYLTLPDGVAERCFSLDGQGFSEAFLDKYAANVAARAGNIVSYAERRDFVNCLGFYATLPRFFSGYRGDIGEYGQPLPYFHCPDSLRRTDGKPGEPNAKGCLSQLVNKLVTSFLAGGASDETKRDTCMDIVSLMTKDFHADTSDVAEAIVRVLSVFFDLLANSEEFDDDILCLLTDEGDLIVSTVNFAFGRESAPEESPFGKEIVRKLTLAAILSPKLRSAITGSAAKLSFFAGKLAESETIPLVAKYVGEFAEALQG
ncbi:MAG: DUF2974 domain-containing protein [Oscillospiraceae bacterium]|jgi:hypothetical protein|nr:DUF2974 domain-containing protein [Oscillospiraceae bacterium]